MNSIIEAQLAGISYPETAGQILQTVREYFDQEKAPPWPTEADADISTLSSSSGLLGVITPHIDLRVSPLSYAHAFAPLLKEPPASAYLILGVGHQSRQEWCIDPRTWSTPLGDISVDPTLPQQLADEVGPELLQDPGAFEHEHSIEFPLVLLQALCRLRGWEADFRIAPVLCGGLYSLLDEFEDAASERERLARLAQSLHRWWEAQAGDVRLIVSIDGCHQGPRFDHPYEMDPTRLKQTQVWEDFLWHYVERQDLEGLLIFLKQDGNARHFDGVGALALLLSMFPGELQVKRTYYEQWFEPRDASMVSFTSGRVMQS